MKSLLLLLTVAFIGTSAFAQPASVDGKKIKVISAAEAPVYENIKTAKGIRVVSNDPGNYFSIEIPGKKIGMLPGAPLRFQVDGKYLEIMTHVKAPFVKAANKRGLTDLEILEWHRQWY